MAKQVRKTNTDSKNPTMDRQKVERVMIGTVLSDKMNKTVVVGIERTYLHPQLNKVMRTIKRYKVHDESQKARSGDIVKIREGRPMSKTKYMYLADVIQSSKLKE